MADMSLKQIFDDLIESAKRDEDKAYITKHNKVIGTIEGVIDPLLLQQPSLLDHLRLLNIEPAQGVFPTAGGNMTFKIVSNHEGKLAFKVKTSNNACYRVRPEFGFVNAGKTTDLEVMRLTGPPKDDNMVVQWADVPPEETDPKAPFAADAQSGEVILPLKAE